MSGDIKADSWRMENLYRRVFPNVDQLDEISSKLVQVESGISSRVMNRANVEGELASLMADVRTSRDSFASTCAGITQCINGFENADNALANSMRGVGYLAAGVAAGPLGLAAYTVLAHLVSVGAIDINKVFGLGNGLNDLYTNIEGIKLELLKFGAEKKLGEDLDKKLLLAGLAVGGSVSLLHGEGMASGKYGFAQGSYDVLKAEAEAKAGVFYENGMPVIGAELGASACALQLDGIISTPDNPYAQLYAKGNAKVLEAKAGLEATLGLTKTKVGAEIGASLVSVEGTLGGKLGPVEAGVTGEFKVGIGAKAELGWEDGKLKCELGAALGIGASIKFEVGLSQEACQVIQDTAVKTAATVSKIVEKAPSAIMEAVSNPMSVLNAAVDAHKSIVNKIANIRLPFL
jgi:hypothetical protein